MFVIGCNNCKWLKYNNLNNNMGQGDVCSTINSEKKRSELSFFRKIQEDFNFAPCLRKVEDYTPSGYKNRVHPFFHVLYKTSPLLQQAAQILEKKWEYKGTVHQLFIDFKKAYDSLKKDVLYNILIEFGIPKKLLRLIKMCRSETYSKDSIHRYCKTCLCEIVRICLVSAQNQYAVFLPIYFVRDRAYLLVFRTKPIRVPSNSRCGRGSKRCFLFQSLVERSLPSKETLRGYSDGSFRGEGYIQCCVGLRLCDMYSNQELAEIHFMYGKADGNAALARRLYQERYPQRQCPDQKTFVRLHYRLCE
ncbi:hypothetical protein ANN_25237 [Periplaneta americana]|uniref:DUF4817 domain-containing protein n=1 Tax=Periplaneta americana TaxID=6978 RepID=A0ABQ8S0T1_PERAM|nr:hypothetical protein ANN_25237 [Periplaneta americana]